MSSRPRSAATSLTCGVTAGEVEVVIGGAGSVRTPARVVRTLEGLRGVYDAGDGRRLVYQKGQVLSLYDVSANKATRLGSIPEAVRALEPVGAGRFLARTRYAVWLLDAKRTRPRKLWSRRPPRSGYYQSVWLFAHRGSRAAYVLFKHRKMSNSHFPLAKLATRSELYRISLPKGRVRRVLRINVTLTHVEQRDPRRLVLDTEPDDDSAARFRYTFDWRSGRRVARGPVPSWLSWPLVGGLGEVRLDILEKTLVLRQGRKRRTIFSGRNGLLAWGVPEARPTFLLVLRVFPPKGADEGSRFVHPTELHHLDLSTGKTTRLAKSRSGLSVGFDDPKRITWQVYGKGVRPGEVGAPGPLCLHDLALRRTYRLVLRAPGKVLSWAPERLGAQRALVQIVDRRRNVVAASVRYRTGTVLALYPGADAFSPVLKGFVSRRTFVQQGPRRGYRLDFYRRPPAPRR